MNLLLIGEIQPNLPLPGCCPAVEKHILQKTHPEARAASCTAWKLLSFGLARLNISALPEVRFEENGKPVFIDCPLHFSLAHSGRLAAALLSPAPCAVDIEQLRPELPARLENRCMNDAERLAGLNCMQAWTRKECIVKLSGTGLCAHPAAIDSLNPIYMDCFFEQQLQFVQEKYVLSALCMNAQPPQIEKVPPETLF